MKAYWEVATQLHIFLTSQLDGLSVQLHDPLPYALVPLNRIISGTHSWHGSFGDEKNVLRLLEIQSQFLRRSASSIISILTYSSFNHLKHEIHLNKTTL
jgi:hypothetical protein